MNPTRTGGLDLDWARWEPTERATLVFVIRDARILLIRKKRGLGAGKVNGPGGRLEPGESALEGAIREVREELCVTPTGLREMGRQRFQFTDGYAIDVTVFRADGCLGEPRETDEATPLWTPLVEIPYHEMWEDDVLWLPHVIAGRRVQGRYLFDGDRMLSSEVELEEDPGGQAPGASEGASPARTAEGPPRRGGPSRGPVRRTGGG